MLALRVELPARLLGEGITTQETQGESGRSQGLHIHSVAISTRRDCNKGVKGQEEEWDRGDLVTTTGDRVWKCSWMSENDGAMKCSCREWLFNGHVFKI